MTHSALLSGWKAPAAPDRYPDLTVVKFIAEFGSRYRWHLDFSRVDQQSPVERFFASDAERCPLIEWPWCDGMEPREEDRVAIGFVVVVIPDQSGDISIAAADVLAVVEEVLFDVAAGGKSPPSFARH